MDLKHGKQHPWLLSPTQTFQIFAVVFGCNVSLLIALVHGAGQNQNALESIAKSAELSRIREEAQKPLMPAPGESRPPASVLRVSMPEGWRWRGCQVSGAGDVEILLGQ